MYLENNVWPFSVPLSKVGAQRPLDPKAGLQEIEDGLSDRNEMGAMAACLAYVQAQVEYAAERPAVPRGSRMDCSGATTTGRIRVR